MWTTITMIQNTNNNNNNDNNKNDDNNNKQTNKQNLERRRRQVLFSIRPVSPMRRARAICHTGRFQSWTLTTVLLLKSCPFVVVVSVMTIITMTTTNKGQLFSNKTVWFFCYDTFLFVGLLLLLLLLLLFVVIVVIVVCYCCLLLLLLLL